MIKLLISLLVVINSSISFAREIVLTETNHAVLVGEVDANSIDKAVMTLRSLDSSKPRYLYIDSPGGEVMAGMRLINYLRSSEGKGVICVANMAMSMGFVSLQSCETRYVIDNAMLMSHGIAGGVQGYVKQMESRIRLAKGLEFILDLIQAKRLGITIAELHRRQDAEWWLIGSDAIIQARAADGVVSVSCDKNLGKPKKYKNTDGTISTIYNCPL